MAQDLGVRLGAGPALTGDLGATAIVGVHLANNRFMARVDGQFVGTGGSADWESSARVASLGVSAGLVQRRAQESPRGYALLGAGLGLDPREGDEIRSLGVVVGVERTTRFGIFGELRAERWLQHGPLHHDLPNYALTAVFGLVIH